MTVEITVKHTARCSMCGHWWDISENDSPIDQECGMCKKTDTDERIAALRKELKGLYTGWTNDGCVPPNKVRTSGLAEEIAKVDRWCGRYQDPCTPKFIGWIARKANRSEHGVIPVDGEDVEHVMQTACDAADAALEKLYRRKI